MALEAAWIPLAGALFGGVGLKMLEYWLGRSKVKIDEASQIREELRTEITSLREEIRGLEVSVNDWRSKYLDLRDKHVELNTQLTLALEKLKQEAVDAPKG